MKRHPFNAVSFGFGVLFIVIAAGVALPSKPWWFGIPPWLIPVALLLLGALIMRPLFTMRVSDEPSPVEGDHPDSRNLPE